MRKIECILDNLSAMYPDAHCELNYDTVWQLLVAVILSAQCTDKRVNEVTPALFARAKTPYDFVNMPVDELEKLIFSCGFYHNKAKNIKSAAAAVNEHFRGQGTGGT